MLRTIGAGSCELISGLCADLATTIEPHGQPGHCGHLFLRGTYDATTKVGVVDYRGEGGA